VYLLGVVLAGERRHGLRLRWSVLPHRNRRSGSLRSQLKDPATPQLRDARGVLAANRGKLGGVEVEVEVGVEVQGGRGELRAVSCRRFLAMTTALIRQELCAPSRAAEVWLAGKGARIIRLRATSLVLL
jgi:hypothetical protein